MDHAVNAHNAKYQIWPKMDVFLIQIAIQLFHHRQNVQVINIRVLLGNALHVLNVMSQIILEWVAWNYSHTSHVGPNNAIGLLKFLTFHMVNVKIVPYAQNQTLSVINVILTHLQCVKPKTNALQDRSETALVSALIVIFVNK